MDLTGIIGFDKSLLLALNGSQSLFCDGFFWFVTEARTWIVLYMVLLYLIFKNNKIQQSILLLVSIGILILIADQLASGLFKPLIGRLRPTHDVEIGTIVATVNGYRGGQFGFFSSHAANSFAIAVFMAQVVKDRCFGLTMLVWASLMSYSRIYVGVHYPGDVITGALVGSVIAFAIYLLYTKVSKRFFIENQYVSTQYTPSGYEIHDLYRVYIVMLLLIFYCIIRGLIFSMSL